MFVGHVRFAADGAAEFATGWNDAGAPKASVSALARPALLRNRGWFDAYATSSVSEPFEIESCRCGSRPASASSRPFFGGTSPLKR
jgi:hypothetical protein